LVFIAKDCVYISVVDYSREKGMIDNIVVVRKLH